MTDAHRIRVTGTVQGVGFRPFVARLAESHHLSGWVLNGRHGVEIHVQGPRPEIAAFERALPVQAPAVARIERIDVVPVAPDGSRQFLIRESEGLDKPTARISPDLPVCSDCLAEMSDPDTRRFAYPYITCTNCGPRYSIIRELPYDRERTTMAAWEMCAECRAEYRNSRDRRFHAEPIACPRCGPGYRLLEPRSEGVMPEEALKRAALLLREGHVVAIKGVGGYHLSCDAGNRTAILALRGRKYRKSKPFAVMAKDLATAHAIVELDETAEALLSSAARPIVLARARVAWPDVAPDHCELGVMLPYAPVHHLLFEAGAPDVLVMTSANRSSEPIAFEDADALLRLDGIADAFLVGDRPIARRVDDSIARRGESGPIILRRGRGYAPGIVARLPASEPILAVGADLKNTIALVVGGDVLVSQHIGDLEHASAYDAFQATIRDVTAMYDLDVSELLIVHDAHPHYASTAYASELPGRGHQAAQHHRAHVASVLAERGELDARVVGVAFDGTGYGDDGTVWGGEFFVGSVAGGFSRVASLRPFALPGGDAAARWPVQAAAGILLDVHDLPDLSAAPFSLGERYGQARRLAQSGLRTFTCTSAGRLFDAAAALLGFTRAIEYEGQAAAGLEQLALTADTCEPLPIELTERHVDMRPALHALIDRRRRGHDPATVARAFHEAVASGIGAMASRLCDAYGTDTVILSGGTFQNALLVAAVRRRLPRTLGLWMNQHVPPNDGGISLGQAALAALNHTGANTT